MYIHYRHSWIYTRSLNMLQISQIPRVRVMLVGRALFTSSSNHWVPTNCRKRKERLDRESNPGHSYFPKPRDCYATQPVSGRIINFNTHYQRSWDTKTPEVLGRSFGTSEFRYGNPYHVEVSARPIIVGSRPDILEILEAM